MIFRQTVLSWFIHRFMVMSAVSVVGLSMFAQANESATPRLTLNEPTPSVQFGVVNHGRETGVSAQLFVPQHSISYGVSLDKSPDETHAIIGVGKSLSQGYVYGTASYARENHFDTSLSAYGASVGGAYLTPWVKIDGNIIAHQGRDKHLDSTVTNSTQTSESITGNIKTITTTHTRTTTERTFVGDVRGYANVGATVNVGQNGELRAGVQHEFGMNDDTHANIQYRHYFNDNRSKAHLYADTNKRYETGIEHAITDAVSMSAVVFSEQYHDDRNHGGMLGFTYRFGAGKASALRTADSHNANARMNAELRDVLHTISPHTVKNIDTLGEVRTTQTVEQSTAVTTTPIRTPDMIKAEVEAYMATVEKFVKLWYDGRAKYTFDLRGLPNDVNIVVISTGRASNVWDGQAYADYDSTKKTLIVGIRNSTAVWVANHAYADIRISDKSNNFYKDYRFVVGELKEE